MQLCIFEGRLAAKVVKKHEMAPSKVPSMPISDWFLAFRPLQWCTLLSVEWLSEALLLNLIRQLNSHY